MPDGFASAWRQVVDVYFPEISRLAAGLLFQQSLLTQFGLQLLAAAVVARKLFEMPAHFPEQKRRESAVFGRIISLGSFGVSQPNFLFCVLNDIAVTVGEMI